MAFTASNITKIANLLSLTAATDNTPGLFFYPTADTVAVVSAAGYFNAYASKLEEGAVIDAACADGRKLFKVSAVAAGVVTFADAGQGVAGVAGGYKVARGVAAVTGTLDVNTGLATVVAADVSLAEDPALTCDQVSYVAGGVAGHITVKAWKPTAANDCTPIAATAPKNVAWIAIGT